MIRHIAYCTSCGVSPGRDGALMADTLAFDSPLDRARWRAHHEQTNPGHRVEVIDQVGAE